MFRIKRTKTAPEGPAGPGGPTDPTTVAYAVSVAPRGNVTAWTLDSARAKGFSSKETAKVLAFYKNVKNAGTLDLEEFDDTEEGPEQEQVPVKKLPRKGKAAKIESESKAETPPGAE